MPPGINMRGGEKAPKFGASLKDLKKDSTVFRLFRFIFKNYKIHFGVVLFCIAVSSLTSLVTSLFTRTLIDDYIAPMLAAPRVSTLFGDIGAGPDYRPLALALFKVGAILLAGIIAGYISNLIMIRVGQGTMKRLRDNVFCTMEKLPLR